MLLVMTDDPASPITVWLDGFSDASDDPDFARVVLFMIEQHGLQQILVKGILELVPEAARWRLTLTDDIVSTVNRLTERSHDNSYTTARGAGHAGAITLPNADGTFDVVISAHALFVTREDAETVEALIAHAFASAEHLSRHEAGHAALRLREEDADSYRGVGGLSKSEVIFCETMAAHVDDNRIEQYTAFHAPSPLRHVDHLADAIAHVRSELNEAKRTWRADIDGSASRTLRAANGLFRVFAYLAAELGLNEDGSPRRPDLLPEGWDDYVERSWDSWSLTFHRLKPVDESMTTGDLGAVCADLCRLAVAWLRSIGVECGVTDDDQLYIYWERDRY